MLGRIVSIGEDNVFVKLDINIYEMDNIIGKNVIFDGTSKIVGEITTIENNIINIILIGEFIHNEFVFGSIVKPSFKEVPRLINPTELDIIFKKDKNVNAITLGKSFIYKDYNIDFNVNTFFSNHFAILGNTGSGKSYSVAKIIQSVFNNSLYLPFYTNIFLFDAYGEYEKAFNNIGNNNENINYKVYTTNIKSNEYEHIRIPFWLLGVDDIALLLDVTESMQISVIEKALKLVSYFAKEEHLVIKQKTDIIARSLLDIIFSSKNTSEIRNKIVSVLSKFNTSLLNLETKLTQPGWTRTLKQCIFIEKTGKFADIELVIAYLESLTCNDFELFLPDGSYKYTIQDFAFALEFSLVSEGILNSDKVYDYANILKIRLNTLINGDYVQYFKFDQYITKTDYIKWLLTTKNGKKAQVINFNINYVDDRFAKTLVKIYSKLLFNYVTLLPKRATFPIHIVLEEAHRYVQNDNDVKILGYNIFERIVKEGRKYGILLGLISQRPSEMSETTLSQCSNFLVFKMFYPKDLSFITQIIPSVNMNATTKLKTLFPGVCLAFGNAFRMPTLLSVDKPNPEPTSSNCDINVTWYVKR